jgi:hypothetical protein
MSRTLLYIFLAISAFGFAAYSAMQCFISGMAGGGLRGAVGRETALHHFGTWSQIWFWAFVLSLIVCGLSIRTASSRRS